MKSLKNLLVPFIIVIALVICAIVYLIADYAGKNNIDESSSGMIEVVYYNLTDISSLSVYNRDTGITSNVKCSLNSDGTVHFDYVGDDSSSDEKYSQMSLYKYIEALSSFYSSSKVSGAGNFSDYGLDFPAFTITINGNNGINTTLYLGNKSPDGMNCYMYVAGTKDIYSVNVNKMVEAGQSAINFLETMNLGIDYSELSKVHFDRKSDGLSIDANVEITQSGIAVFDIFKPYSHPASSYFGILIDKIVGLEIAEYISVEDSELSKYGLDDPDYHFVLTMNNGSKTELYFSREQNGYYYGFVKGIKKYFVLSELQLEGLNFSELVLIDPYISYCYAKNISSITGTYGSKQFRFELDVKDGQSISSEDSSVVLDGRNARVFDSEGRSYSSILFESLSCIKIGGIETGASVNTSAGPVISFSFNDKSYNSTVYDFYTRDDDSFYVFKDGTYTDFYVYSGELFNDGGLDTYSYGCWRAYELLSEAISNNMNGIYDIPREE